MTKKCSIFTTALVSIFVLWAITFANLAYSDDEAPVKIAIIGDISFYRDKIPLLIENFSSDNRIQVLEREEIDRILSEKELLLKDKSIAGTMKVGKMLGADGVMILQAISYEGKNYVGIRLVSVRAGIALSSLILPEEESEIIRWTGAVVEKFRPLMKKLKLPRDAAVTLSFLYIHDENWTQIMENVEKDKDSKISWDASKESDEYLKEANWAFIYEDFDKAWKNADAAFALGNRSADVYFLRIRSRINQLHKGGVSSDSRIVSSEIDTLLAAMNIYYDMLLSFNDFFILKGSGSSLEKWGVFCDIIRKSSLLFRDDAYDANDANDAKNPKNTPENLHKLKVLQNLIRKCATITWNCAGEGGLWPYNETFLWCYGLLHPSPEQAFTA
jgi:hypothetical protein